MGCDTSADCTISVEKHLENDEMKKKEICFFLVVLMSVFNAFTSVENIRSCILKFV